MSGAKPCKMFTWISVPVSPGTGKNNSMKLLLVPAVWHVNARAILRASKDPGGIKPAPMAYLNSMKKE